MSNSSWPGGLQPTWLLRPWDLPGKTTGVGRHCPLHEVPRGEEHRYRLWTHKGIKREKLKTKNRGMKDRQRSYTRWQTGGMCSTTKRNSDCARGVAPTLQVVTSLTEQWNLTHKSLGNRTLNKLKVAQFYFLENYLWITTKKTAGLPFLQVI